VILDSNRDPVSVGIQLQHYVDCSEDDMLTGVASWLVTLRNLIKSATLRVSVAVFIIGWKLTCVNESSSSLWSHRNLKYRVTVTWLHSKITITWLHSKTTATWLHTGLEKAFAFINADGNSYGY